MEDLEDKTVKGIFQSIGRLSLKKIVSIVTVSITVLSAVFFLGRYSYQKEAAVLLDSPFSMRVVVNSHNNDFDSVTLTRDPTFPTKEQGKVALSIRQIQGEFDIVQVGVIIASVEPSELTKVWARFASLTSLESLAYAESNKFDWHGHNPMKAEKSLDDTYSETFVSKDTVNRLYVDGCILEYKVDANRRSIPSSFKWIKLTHE